MKKKPKIELSLNKLDRTLDLLSNVLVIVMWLLTIFVFIKSPTIIPTHFNASGIPDDYGNKISILILPIIATVIYFGISWLTKNAHILNYSLPITEGNAHHQYILATRNLRITKLIVLFIFTVLLLLTYLTAVGFINTLGVWFLPILIVLMLIPVFIPIIISLRMKS